MTNTALGEYDVERLRREEFPVLVSGDRVFLDAACVSLLPESAKGAVAALLDDMAWPRTRDATAHHIALDQARSAALEVLAEYLSCPLERLALVESTTHGLSVAASLIPWSADGGDEVLISDLEYLQVALPFRVMEDRGRLRVRFVAHDRGVVCPERFSSAATARTKAIVVSATQWSHGARVDMPALADVAKRTGAYLIVDGVQQIGAIPLDLSGVDALTAGGHKWLNSPLGTGFLYLSPRLIASTPPPFPGYMSLLPPEGGWGHYFATPTTTPDRTYQFVPTARSCELGGTGNYPGAVALEANLRLMLKLGPDAVARHILKLGDHLLNGLLPLADSGKTRLTVATPPERAGIIAFTYGDRLADERCLNRLLDNRIQVSQRYTSGVGGIRVSLHMYNTRSDVDRLLEVLRE